MRRILLPAALLLLCGTTTAQHITIQATDSVRAQVGAEVYGIQYHARTYNDPVALTRLGALPLTGVRVWAYPSVFHPAPGVWEWAALDAQIAEVVRAGYTPWVCLFQAEEWYAGSPEDPWWNDTAHWAAWRSAAGALADRYGDRVDRWIIFDEVNYLHPDRDHYMAPAVSARLYLEAARALRAADPDARVGGPSGFARWENGYWATRVLAQQGGAAHLDFVSSNLFVSWDASDSDALIMDRTIWYEEAPLKIRAMLGGADTPPLVLDAYNASALWTRDGTPGGTLWTDPRNVNTFGGVYQAAALLHSIQGGFEVTLRWETLGGFGILSWYPAFRRLPPYYAWQLLAGPGRLLPGSTLLHTTTTEPPRQGLPHHSGQDVAGYTVQPFAVRDADGQSIILINKYAAARQVSVVAPYAAGRYAVYRFDADRHAAALDPLVDGRGIARGEPVPLTLPGLSVTVVSFPEARPTHADREPGAPARSRLLPNAPNPFRGATRIPVELASDGPLTLDVFSARGRRVAALAAGPMRAGTHTFTFDAAGLAAGTYFYRLCTAKGCTTRPMAYLR